ncbi:MAG TPA: SDR family NAD(P)-dependent oxidoreductase [Acidimicrobiia bacterium]|nr:SDR family NAD(P)-dependent oxidoreductase [Acidimicrobiia bacterium]
MDLDTVLDRTLAGYTRVGSAIRRRAWECLPAEALAGSTAVVTGSTRGIGRAAAEGMAALGARVVVVARNPMRVAAAVDEITASTGADVRGEVADLSLMAEVRALADRLMGAEPRIDLLVNNAGALFPERALTDEGIERTFALDLLGHYVLTEALVPRLVESAPARIINVTSGGMYTQRISTSDLEAERGAYDGRKQYARMKRGQVILSEEWAKRLEGTGVVVHAMHPGWVDTPGVESGIPLFHRVMKPLLRKVDDGADTIVWLGASDEAGATTGAFWHDRRERPTHRIDRTRETTEQRERLMAELARYAGL